MRFETLLLFAFGLCAVSAQTCRIPDVWESHVFEHDSRRTYSRYTRFYYDETNQRVAYESTTETAGGERYSYDDIYLFYPQRTQYHINTETKMCEKRNITTSFPRFELPFNARLLAPLYIGAESYSYGLRVNFYEDTSSSAGERNVIGIAPTGCVPVRTYRFYPAARYNIQQDYYDVRLGDNPDHFVPPTNCE